MFAQFGVGSVSFGSTPSDGKWYAQSIFFKLLPVQKELSPKEIMPTAYQLIKMIFVRWFHGTMCDGCTGQCAQYDEFLAHFSQMLQQIAGVINDRGADASAVMSYHRSDSLFCNDLLLL